MKRQPLHLLWFALFAFLFSHCTMEKRLYNRGYHIESKRTFQTNKTEEPTKPDVIYDAFPSDEFTETDEPIFENASHTLETEELSEVQDSSVVLAPDQIVKDTVYIYDDYGSNIRRKERNLLLTGIPAFVFGAISFRWLAMAGATGANTGGFFIFGGLGLITGIVAIILLCAFLIVLCIPANPGVKKTPPEETAAGKKSKLSKGENAALTICLLAFGLIGLGFLAANVF